VKKTVGGSGGRLSQQQKGESTKTEKSSAPQVGMKFLRAFRVG